jgi:hypothetical protein
MQFFYRSKQQPTRRSSTRASRRNGKLSARRLRLESLETRTLLAVTNFISATAPSKGIVPTAAYFDDIGTDWTGGVPSFDESTWTSSVANQPNGIGAPLSGAGNYGNAASISAASMVGTSNTAFLRIPFNVTNAASFNKLTLNVLFDDGFIAYLNGQEVMRQNSEAGYPIFAMKASAAVASPVFVTNFTSFDISNHLGALTDGPNVLAIRGFDRPGPVFTFPNSEDFVIQATLTGEAPDVAPTANPDSVSYRTDAADPIINVLANDTQGTFPFNPASVEIVDQPTGGTATVNANGTITYSENALFAGTDTFTYRFRDTNPAPTQGGTPVQTTVVSTTAAHRRLVPVQASVTTGWEGAGAFDDITWTAAQGGIGYDDAVDYDQWIGIGGDVTATMDNINTSVYARYPFTLTNTADVTGFILRMRYDDGFIAYINGVRVFATPMAPAAPAWNSVAGQGHEAAAAQEVFNIPLTGIPLRTGVGGNILAIHGLNEAVGSSDFLIQPELIAESASRGTYSNTATVTVNVTGPGPVTSPDTVPVINVVEQQPEGVIVDVLANDVPGFSGAAIRPDTVRVTVPPANGTTQVDPATGQIHYVPRPGFSGDDVFTYTVRDNAPVGGSGNATWLPRGSVWKYLDDGSDQGTAWRNTTFNDTTWASGPAELGFTDAPVTPVRCQVGQPVPCVQGATDKFITHYFRHSFNLDDPTSVQTLNILASYDDGAVVYINGTEVARSANMPAGTIAFNTLANPDHEGGTFESLATLTAAQLTMLRAGTNVVAVEIHQNAATSSDMTFDLEVAGTVSTPTGNLSNPSQVRIHVNAPPIAANDIISVGPFGTMNLAQPAATTFFPLGNDNDPDNSPSGTPGVTGINRQTLVITQQPSEGTVTYNPATGAMTFTTTGGLTNPETLTFKYTVRDFQNALSNEATVTVNVVVVLPDAVDDAAATPEGQSVVINALANDITGDLTIIPSSITPTQPANGTVTVNSANNTLIYTPNAGFRDQFDTFTYTIRDRSNNESLPATVTVDVFSLAIAREDGFALNQGAPSVTIPIANFLANDYYPSSFQPEIVIVANSQSRGTAVINVVGGVQQSVTFTMTPGSTGVGGFTYFLRDAQPNPTRPNSNNARVNIALGAITISGTVYVDVNNNNQIDATEQLVPGATIVLTRAGDPTFRVTTTTGSDPGNLATYGKYVFASTSAGVLPPDTYTITQIQPALYLDFPTGAVNSHTALLTAPNNPGFNFREWTINPQFLTTVITYGGGFLASQQPVSLSAGSIVVPYDRGWNGAFNAKATYNPALGDVSVKLYNASGAVVANSATNPSSTPGNSVINYTASPSQKYVLVVSGTNPDVSIQSPNLGTTAGDTTAPYVFNTSLSSSTWSPAFRENLGDHMMGTNGYNVAAGETLPWKNLDRISMRFTEAVSVGQNDLRLWGVNVQDYRQEVGIQSFQYDPLTFTATWTLSQPIAADQLRVSLSDAVRDTWGNRVGGTGFETLFNVLPGSIASAGDNPLGQMMAKQFSSIGSAKYSPYFDLDGNGVINFVDAISLRNAIGASLPAGTPATGPTSVPAPQAPSAIVASANSGPANSGNDPSANVVRRREAASAGTTALRAVTRTSQTAAIDAAVSAESQGTSTSSMRARRAARSVDRVLASLDGSL